MVTTLIDLTASLRRSRSRTASSTAGCHVWVKVRVQRRLRRRTNLIERVLYTINMNETRRSRRMAYHGMFDIEVNTRLLWVDTNLDCKINRPVGWTVDYLTGIYGVETYRLMGTRMLSKRTTEGLIAEKRMK